MAATAVASLCEVAAGDIIRMTNHDRGEFEIVVRGGNVCIQFYLPESDINDVAAARRVAAEIARDIEPLGGSMDGHTAGLIAFTIPVGVGFPAIESVFANADERHPGRVAYSNLYDSATGHPLG